MPLSATPDASFTVSASIGCSPLTVNFTNTSTGPILFYYWDFGDGHLSVALNPTHTFINTTGTDTVFTVTLFVTNFFVSDTFTANIRIHPEVQAGFSVSPSFGCHPMAVEIRDASLNANMYQWDFGDGNSSTSSMPVITHNYTNTGFLADTFTIRQIVSSIQGCRDTLERPVIVYPLIEASFIASTTEGCADLTVQFTNTSTLTAQQFHWDFGDGGTSSDPNPVHTFRNTTGTTLNYTVRLTVVSANFCEDTMTMPIRVHPLVESRFDFNPATICSPQSVTFTNNSFGGTSFQWDLGDGTIINRIDTQPVTHTYSHNQANPVVHTVILTTQNPQGCIDTASKTLTVFPGINAGFSPSAISGCNNLTVLFTNTSTGALTYLWDFGDGSTSTTQNPSKTFTNTSFSNDTVFDVWLYAQSQYGCRDSINQSINVFPALEANFSIQSVEGCSPFTVNITNQSRGATAHSWNFGDGHTSSSGSGTLTHTFTNTGSVSQIYTVELIVTNNFGCSDTIRQQIRVFPEVQANFTSLATGCSPLEVSFVNTSVNAALYQWDFGNGVTSGEENPIHTFYNQSHFTDTFFIVTLTAWSTYGCISTDTSHIRVLPKPASRFIILNSPGCSPHEAIIYNSSSGATQFFWDFGDGSPVSNAGGDTIRHLFIHNHGTGPGNFDITLITGNAFGCTDTLVQRAIIYPTITAEFTVNTLSGCHPLTVEFTNISTGADAQIPFYWDFGDGNTSDNGSPVISHTFHNISHTRDTVYNIMLVARNINGCTDTTTASITVFATPKALFSFPNTQACAPYEINISNLSIGASSFSWDMADGTTYTYSGNFNHTYTVPAGSSPHQFSIMLNVANVHGCSNSYSKQIMIFPEVIADFSVDNEGCHPHPTIFENLSVGADLFYWNFGNGNLSQQINPQHQFLNFSHTDTISYNVSLRSESHHGCYAETAQRIVVWPVPRPNFALSEPSGCSPFSPVITNLSTGATFNEWDFGNGLSANNDTSFTHTWSNITNNPINYTTTLRVRNNYGCEAVTSQIKRVYPEVTAAFGLQAGSWEGCSPSQVRFINQSSLASTFRWNFDDGTTSLSANPQHVFNNNDINARVFNVRLTANSLYGCRDTVSRQIRVLPTPQVNFTATPHTQPYPNTTITLTNLTNPGNWNFRWEFGDGNYTTTNSFQPITHTYDWSGQDMNTKTYTVALMATNGQCSGMFTQRVRITSPVPDARFDAVWSGCVPFTVQFTNRSRYSNRFWWDFGNGSVSNEVNPTHTFQNPGIYNVQLTAFGDGGVDSVVHIIEALANPVADFDLQSTLVQIPDEPLRLTNNSLMGDFFIWDFGDGNISSEIEPVHFYQQPGIYDITLIAITNTSPQCSDTLVKQNALRVAETCKILFPNAFMPGATVSPGSSYNPYLPSITVFHPVHTGIDEDEYILEIYTRWGELVFRTEDLHIGWDGKINGRPAPMGVYVWKVKTRCSDGTQIYKAGDVTLYR